MKKTLGETTMNKRQRSVLVGCRVPRRVASRPQQDGVIEWHFPQFEEMATNMQEIHEQVMERILNLFRLDVGENYFK